MLLKEFGHETLHAVSWLQYEKMSCSILGEKLSYLNKFIFLFVAICKQDENVTDSVITLFLFM